MNNQDFQKYIGKTYTVKGNVLEIVDIRDNKIICNTYKLTKTEKKEVVFDIDLLPLIVQHDKQDNTEYLGE